MLGLNVCMFVWHHLYLNGLFGVLACPMLVFECASALIVNKMDEWAENAPLYTIRVTLVGRAPNVPIRYLEAQNVDD